MKILKLSTTLNERNFYLWLHGVRHLDRTFCCMGCVTWIELFFCMGFVTWIGRWVKLATSEAFAKESKFNNMIPATLEIYFLWVYIFRSFQTQDHERWSNCSESDLTIENAFCSLFFDFSEVFSLTRNGAREQRGQGWVIMWWWRSSRAVDFPFFFLIGG